MKKLITIALMAFSLFSYSQESGERCAAYQSPYFGETVLTANPTAVPDHICAGQSVHLIPVPDGGDPAYTYTWTSDPPGFTSNLAEPLVNPLVTTTYTVIVSDGSNTVTGNVTVTVNPVPVVPLIPDVNTGFRIISSSEICLCPYDSVILDAGNPGCSYSWNNGSNSRLMKVQTSGISFDEQSFEVTVTNPTTGCSTTADMRVVFTFAECIYGIKESNESLTIDCFPNPSGDGIFNIFINKPSQTVNYAVYNSVGNLIMENKINLNGSSKFSISLNNQPTGIYYLKVSNNSFSNVSKILVK